MRNTVKLRFLLSALLVTGLAACSRELATSPMDEVLAENTIVDAPTARAALAGAYSGLQALGYYGRNLEILGDLPSDNAVWTGTFQYLGDIDRNDIKADNTTTTSVWTAIYAVIARTNMVLTKVPNLADLSTAEKNEILGEAHFLRALSYHNLVKLWGAVPMPLEPILVASDASKYQRVPVTQVYTQILGDLDQAGQLITNTSNTRQATVMAVHAIRARVMLYNANYQGALDEANIVLAGRDTLTVAYPDLFTATGTNTSEDIFRVAFTPVQYNEMGYYYLFDGRWEVAPTADLAGTFEANDLRAPLTVAEDGGDYEGTKFPTTEGTEHLHVIRFAEVLLNKAEALARLNQLAGAVDTLNIVRARANLPALQLGVDVTDQQSVLDAIWHERRVELALEGFRFGDLVRTGQAVAVLGLGDRPGQILYPIPQRERNVTPGLGQNAGY